jgi:hypothetical protein
MSLDKIVWIGLVLLLFLPVLISFIIVVYVRRKTGYEGCLKEIKKELSVKKE